MSPLGFRLVQDETACYPVCGEYEGPRRKILSSWSRFFIFLAIASLFTTGRCA